MDNLHRINDAIKVMLFDVISIHNWGVKKNQPEGPPFTSHMLAICNAKEPVEAKSGSSSKENTGSKIGLLVKATQFSSAKDCNPSQPSASTPVVAELHKEDQQVIGGPTSLGITSEEGANPQLSSVVSASTTKPVYSTSTIIHSKSTSEHND
ncbi:hypothetical protein Tco_1224046 [Tanacetum coccineum]